MPRTDPVFGAKAAAHYEAWYETPEGRRADALEKAALHRLLEHFSHPCNALDIGCGTGHFTRWLHDEGLAAVGLDISAAMLAQARALERPPLARADALRLPFADGTFDVVAMVTTLEFLGRPRVALAEAMRVTRQGLLLGVLNRWSVMGLRRRLIGCFRPTVYDAARFYGVRELARLLRGVSGGQARVEWITTLFPPWWPWPQSRLPCGGFIAMAAVRGSDRT
ncbi:MAG: class I SAM-dependent methyltransferase [Anaerolineales bacterium]